MVESLRPDLAAHRGAPDKTPERRLATLEAAGELAIPFTTGILVGIGETEADRVEALEAIAAAHRRHGHVQEVIVQNFLPKPGTAMRGHEPCPPEEHLRAIALARLVLPADVHVQAPPNLSDTDRLGDLLDAGIDDWGGVSPVTPDHVNPERPWPAIDVLRAATEERGLALAPRLTVYPEYLAARASRPAGSTRPPPSRCWTAPTRRALGRDDPGAIWPERHQAAANVGTGAEVVQIGRRSTGWYSGADVAPAGPAPGAPGSVGARAGGAVGEVLAGVRAGQEPGEAELVTLFGARGPEVAAVAGLADELRVAAVGDTVTYVVNRNINYTNVCTYRCTFCGFSKGPLSLNLRGKPYLLTIDDVAERTVEAAARGATEVCLQGGIHPSFDGDFYVEVTRAVKEAVPGIHVHGFTALEVTEGAKRLGEPLAAYLTRLQDAGLGSLPGTAAEILDDEVRAVLCPDKVDTEEWLDAHRTAHRVGLRSNITIMFGSVERPVHWARHLIRTRDLQKETGGFTEFVPLPFVHMAAPVYLKRGRPPGPDLARVRADARRGPDRLRRLGRQHPGLVGQARPARCAAAADGRRQRPRRHADGREHQPRRRRRARPARDRRRARGARRVRGPHGRPAHHPLRHSSAARPGRLMGRQPDDARAVIDSRRLYLDAAALAVDLIRSPAVGERWDQPAVLAEYDVGALAAHLARAVFTLEIYLDAPEPDASADVLDPAAYYAAVLGDADPVDSDLHRGVRQRSAAAAESGQAALVADLERSLARQAALDLSPDRLVAVLGGVVVRLATTSSRASWSCWCMATTSRAASGGPTPAYADEAWQLVVSQLHRIAVDRHGARVVALSLARPERGSAGAFG